MAASWWKWILGRGARMMIHVKLFPAEFPSGYCSQELKFRYIQVLWDALVWSVFFFNIVKLIQWFIIRKKMTMKIFWTTQRLVGYLLAVYLKIVIRVKEDVFLYKKTSVWNLLSFFWGQVAVGSLLPQRYPPKYELKFFWLFKVKVTHYNNEWESVWFSKETHALKIMFWKWDFCCWQPVISCGHL